MTSNIDRLFQLTSEIFDHETIQNWTSPKLTKWKLFLRSSCPVLFTPWTSFTSASKTNKVKVLIFSILTRLQQEFGKRSSSRETFRRHSQNLPPIPKTIEMACTDHSKFVEHSYIHQTRRIGEKHNFQWRPVEPPKTALRACLTGSRFNYAPRRIV